jgi:3-deoxy-D-arabino-heptulosonate 7-phosphate (DAHP) synthase class II
VAAVDLAASGREALQPMVANTVQTITGVVSQHVVEVVEEVDNMVQVAQVVGGTLGLRIFHRGSLEQQGRPK